MQSGEVSRQPLQQVINSCFCCPVPDLVADVFKHLCVCDSLCVCVCAPL